MKTESIRVSSRLIVMMLMIIVVSLAVYFNTLFNGFVFDDMFQILRNPWITDIRSISKIFSANVWTFAGLESNYYRPLMHIFYMGSYYVLGLEPWGFHLMNMLFHAGISTLVFLVISQLFQGFLNPASKYYLYAPFVAGMLFATHPIHTEVVAPIMGITDLSFTFFYLLSFYLYIRSGEGLSWGYLFSVISFLTSTLCKEPALTLPLILLAYDYAFQRWPPSILSFVQRYAAYLIAAGGYFSLRYFALGGVTALKENVGLTFIQYVLNTLYLFALYLKKLFLPVDLNFLFVFEPITSVADRRGILFLV